mgnify:FL=1
MLLSDKLLYLKVKSAFGCMPMIKTNVYNKIEWGDSICEHHSFCENIQKYGDIYVDMNTHVINSHLNIYTNMYSYDEMEKYLKSKH